MKLIKKLKDEKDRDILVCEFETKFLFWKQKTEKRFLAQTRLCSTFYRWVELPDKIIVNDSLSFQLDSFNQN